ncbi:MAG: FkbM family methyltransferase [Lewinellaceae bacterium]|nr:FkbM family methyltransferase [Saprospiraceae bacterium]MCB9338352.1 FkbM family methyltransferase [Lewinellaceae bacterium]
MKTLSLEQDTASPSKVGNLGNSTGWMPANLSGKLFKWYLLLPDHPSKIRVENWIGRLFFKQGILVKGFGTKFRLDANDWITRTMIEEGQFEKLSLNLARDIMAKGGNLVDIGANFGFYTCVLGNMPGVRCLSVDASPRIMAKLKANLSLNPSVKTEVVQTALASDYGTVKFFSPDSGNLGMSKTVMADEDAGEDYIVLDSIPLNALLSEKKMKPIKLLKIDIEGFEMEVFKTFDFNGEYRPANILMEYVPKHHSNGLDINGCRQFFESRGYELLNIKGDKIKSAAQIIEDNIWLRSL